MSKIVECVPNISEGRDEKIFNACANAVRKVPGVTLLDVDPGKSTNRTVFTFVGDPNSGTIDQQTIVGQGVVLTFHLPPPDQHGWIAGDVGFRWIFSVTPATRALSPSPVLGPPHRIDKISCTPEDSIHSVVAQMSSSQQADYLKQIKQCRRPPLPKTAGPIKLRDPTQKTIQTTPPLITESARVVSVHEWSNRDCRRQALCSSWKGHVPGNPSLCDDLKY